MSLILTLLLYLFIYINNNNNTYKLHFFSILMGSTIFYIPDELMNDLKSIGNRSALVTSLLREFFEKVKAKPSKEQKQQKLFEAQSLIKEAQDIDKQIIEEEEKRAKEEERNRQIDNIQREEKEKEIKERRREGFKDIFIKNWEINREDVYPLLDEFLELLDSEKIKNILEFMELKQIRRKVKNG